MKDHTKPIMPPSTLVKVRDKFLPSLRLKIKVNDGVVPYDKNDVVALNIGRGTFETSEVAVVQKFLPHIGCFLDVGANLGYFSLLAARQMRCGGRVYAFEASSIEFSKLAWMIARNKLNNVVAVNRAVGNKSEKVTIYESLSGAGAFNRLVCAGKQGGSWRNAQVEMITLDWFDRQMGPLNVDFMKIDVEGYEAPVLEGASELIQRDLPVIMIEMNANRSSNNSNPIIVWNMLSGLGYSWFEAHGETGTLLPVSAPADVINLFAIHMGRRGQIAELVIPRGSTG